MANLSTVDVPAVGRRNILSIETWIMLIGGVIAAFVAYWIGQTAAYSLRDTVMRGLPQPQRAGTSKTDNNKNGNGRGSVVMFQ